MLIENVFIQFHTTTDDREGGIVTVQILHNSQPIFTYGYSEYPAWGENTDNKVTVPVNRDMPVVGLVARITLTDANEKNIGWNFNVYIRFLAPGGPIAARITGLNLRLDTTPYPYPASVHVDVAQ